MKVKNLILVLFFTLFFMKGHSCSCLNTKDFIEMLTFTGMTAKVKVNKFLTFKEIYGESIPMSMDVEIIEVISGEESRKNIIVWGDNGNYCRPYLNKFKEGNYYIISFNRGYDTSSLSDDLGERPTDYAISSCGTTWLDYNIETNNVYGKIESNTTEININELKEKIITSVTNSKIYTDDDFESVFQLVTYVIKGKDNKEAFNFIVTSEVYETYDYFKNNNHPVFNFLSEKDLINNANDYLLSEFKIDKNIIRITLQGLQNISQFVFLREKGKWEFLGLSNN